MIYLAKIGRWSATLELRAPLHTPTWTPMRLSDNKVSTKSDIGECIVCRREVRGVYDIGLGRMVCCGAFVFAARGVVLKSAKVRFWKIHDLKSPNIDGMVPFKAPLWVFKKNHLATRRTKALTKKEIAACIEKFRTGQFRKFYDSWRG